MIGHRSRAETYAKEDLSEVLYGAAIIIISIVPHPPPNRGGYKPVFVSNSITVKLREPEV